MNNSRNKFMRKINFPKRLCFLPVKSQIRTLSKIFKHAVSRKSAKSGPTSKLYKIMNNGRTRPVYDSFWPQGPPKVQKKLVWVDSATYPISRGRFINFWGFLGKFRLSREISKNRVPQLSSSKFFFKNYFHAKTFECVKIEYISSILVYLLWSNSY